MAKYNRNAKARRNRRWLANVGDGAKLTKEGNNPNDKPKEKL
jgi:hypothetical protein